ncbi:MAG: phosphoribosylpyrophosphate synthetase [Flavobacteriales bacterium]|jgi:hypothetical protein|nr:phosphoribosylpyrophosphate synthetase [Flavobacteriales bacterium]
MKESYTTLSEAIADLQKKGYTVDFNLKEEGLLKDSVEKINTDNLEVVKFYRFEGESNPADNSILYVVETGDGRKGLIVDAYGADSSNLAPEVVKKINIHR